MKPNDKAYQAAISAIKENGPYYAGSKIRESMAKHLAEVALPAAYAAQFPPSEDYAGLIKELRSPAMIFYAYSADNGSMIRKAADAIESLLAERDAAIEKRDALAKERDALLARLAPVDDEELVRIAANAICVFVYASPDNKTEFHGQARAAIAAIRPHIEAAERERCAKEYEVNWSALGALFAAAIRSGK